MVTKNVSRSLLNSSYVVNEGVSNPRILISKIKSIINRFISNINLNSINDIDVYNNSKIDICKCSILRQKLYY